MLSYKYHLCITISTWYNVSYIFLIIIIIQTHQQTHIYNKYNQNFRRNKWICRIAGGSIAWLTDDDKYDECVLKIFLFLLVFIPVCAWFSHIMRMRCAKNETIKTNNHNDLVTRINVYLCHTRSLCTGKNIGWLN